jgi:VCBS repeat protein
MTRRRPLPACWTLVVAALAPLAAAPSPASPASPAVVAAAPTAVETSRSGSFETSVFRLPGRLLASAVARDAGGSFGLVVLVADDGGRPGEPAVQPRDAADDPAPGLPRALFFLEPGSAALKRLADALPEKLNALATLAGSVSHGDHLILGEPGILYTLDPPWGGAGASCRRLLAAPGLDLRSLYGESAGEPPRPRLSWVPAARAGRLELLAGEASAPALRELRPVASFPLPIAAARKSWGIQLTSPAVHLLPAPPRVGLASAPLAPPAAGQPASFSPRFAAGPEPQGEQRLKTLLFSATAGEAPVEAWSLMPAAAQDVESLYAIWDGQPVLAVTSIPRFGIFVKRQLHLFLLARDRSRRGNEPLLAVHTDCHLWHPMKTYFADLAATGRQDLVLIHPEGLSGKKLRFQVYTNAGQGRFAAQPRTSSVDVKASDWFYGADFTGDGVPDLLVRDDQSRLLLYPGLAKAYRLADRPSWSFHLPVPPPAKRKTKEDDDGDSDDHPPGPAAPPAVRLADLVDLRGDGHPTLFLAIPDAQGRSQVVAVRRVP